VDGNGSYSCPVMIFHISVSLEEVCVVGESEEQCAYLRELHLYMPKLYILFILRKILGFYCFLFALLGRPKKNDAGYGGEHFLSSTFS
jgi:hypothetical protein